VPRYYFDFVDGESTLTDDEGADLPDADAAYETAQSLALSLLQEPGAGAAMTRASFVVRDEAGAVVLEYPFAEALGPPGTRH